ncbi:MULTISPECIES: small acid-soluble spore protein Tlp [Bacillus]|uniref:Small, acid-soluble spore protein Tlp n=2 Tax=Bacillus TaxID=1386 RepID=A0A0M3R9C2_9BACI|nr:MULTISPECIES: small acid-soluble spore protein Tlp [Bacillus]ALC81166.1 small acid-soluble spore protein Tlp [Bacillus gobiensis]MBP1080141.1 small acid-soluble spore protein (thioredoxin-like protein) [Bacillus capparidis]MED1095525.1 small acid-soluble spore protein Tlp [Bacillus capparidis]
MTENNQPNPDNRSDNVEKLQDMVQNTIENFEEAEDTLQFASNDEKEQIQAKNKRRAESIESMRSEIQDESADRQNNE